MELYVSLPSEAQESNEGLRENTEGNAQGETAALQDEAAGPSGNKAEEEGAWALPEADRRANNRIPITGEGRLRYGAFLMKEFRFQEAIPHLARAALDNDIVRPARNMLTEALMELSRRDILAQNEVEFRRSITAQGASNWLQRRDLECIYCVDVFSLPITTPCGHTFCRHCLEKSLDYRITCALCLQSLELFQFGNVSVNDFIATTLRAIGVERSPMPLDPAMVPILACTVTFPGMPCPLFLFDPRYWYMIRRILESNSRKFGMVACVSSGAQTPFGTLLEIRDCVLLQDGCTIVSTVGVSRFRVVERGVWDGWCDVVKVEPITDIPVESEETIAQLRHLAHTISYKALKWISGIRPELRDKIETAFGFVPYFDAHGCWWTQPDGPAWLWWLISILPLNLQIRILILATNSLQKRMSAVLRTLDASLAVPPHSFCEYESALADWWTPRHL